MAHAAMTLHKGHSPAMALSLAWAMALYCMGYGPCSKAWAMASIQGYGQYAVLLPGLWPVYSGHLLQKPNIQS